MKAPNNKFNILKNIGELSRYTYVSMPIRSVEISDINFVSSCMNTSIASMQFYKSIIPRSSSLKYEVYRKLPIAQYSRSLKSHTKIINILEEIKL